MMDMQALFQAVDALNPEQIEQLITYAVQRKEQATPKKWESPEARVAALHVAIEAFREGSSQEELDELIAAMNYDNIDPDAESPFK